MKEGIYFCKVSVNYVYKKFIPVKKIFYMPLCLDSNGDILFLDYEFTRFHKKIFTPKEKNHIKSVTVERKIYYLSEFNYDTSKDFRNKYNYKELIKNLNKK